MCYFDLDELISNDQFLMKLLGALKKRNDDAIEKLVEEEHRIAGTLVECQCCFAEVLPDRTVPCDGDETHLFCNSCIKQKAEVQVGSMQYELKCFDTSGCQAQFSSKLIRKVIGDKLISKQFVLRLNKTKNLLA